MVPMGFAAAIILCLRAILPDSRGFVMGLSVAATRTIVGSTWNGAPTLSVTSVAVSAPRR